MTTATPTLTDIWTVLLGIGKTIILMGAYAIPIMALTWGVFWFAGWLVRRAERHEYLDHMIPTASEVAEQERILPHLPDDRRFDSDPYQGVTFEHIKQERENNETD